MTYRLPLFVYEKIQSSIIISAVPVTMLETQQSALLLLVLYAPPPGLVTCYRCTHGNVFSHSVETYPAYFSDDTQEFRVDFSRPCLIPIALGNLFFFTATAVPHFMNINIFT